MEIAWTKKARVILEGTLSRKGTEECTTTLLLVLWCFCSFWGRVVLYVDNCQMGCNKRAFALVQGGPCLEKHAQSAFKRKDGRTKTFIFLPVPVLRADVQLRIFRSLHF